MMSDKVGNIREVKTFKIILWAYLIMIGADFIWLILSYHTKFSFLIKVSLSVESGIVVFFGYSTCTDPSEHITAVQKKADRACYADKKYYYEKSGGRGSKAEK